MNLLVTGAWNCTDRQLNSVEELGNRVFFMQNEKDPLPLAYDEVEGVICNGLFLYHPIEKFQSLKYIQLTSAGLDRVPMEYVRSKNIRICNARGVYSIPMAEYAVFGVLQLYKRGRFFYENQLCKRWEKSREIIELFGKTVCIVGCGSVGTECAIRFSAFGCSVIGVDISPREDANYHVIYPLTALDSALRKSDIVICTLPLTNQTVGFINAAVLDAMKSGAIFVNIARGAVVNADDLISALKNKLFGAVLDVFEEEPLSEDSPLWNMQNVMITPHNSFVGDGNNDRLYRLILRNLEDLKK